MVGRDDRLLVFLCEWKEGGADGRRAESETFSADDFLENSAKCTNCTVGYEFIRVACTSAETKPQSQLTAQLCHRRQRTTADCRLL